MSGAALAVSDYICLLYGTCTLLEYNCDRVKVDPQNLKLGGYLRPGADIHQTDLNSVCKRIQVRLIVKNVVQGEYYVIQN